MATRLDQVALDADMALDHVPERRGEQMALKALRGLPADVAVPPLEMAVALRLPQRGEAVWGGMAPRQPDFCNGPHLAAQLAHEIPTHDAARWQPSTLD